LFSNCTLCILLVFTVVFSIYRHFECFFGNNDIYYETFKYLQTSILSYFKTIQHACRTCTTPYFYTYIHTQEPPTFSFLVHSREYLTMYNIIIHYLRSIKSSSWFLHKCITIWSCNHSLKCYTWSRQI
jgi:hypothetical protein